MHTKSVLIKRGSDLRKLRDYALSCRVSHEPDSYSNLSYLSIVSKQLYSKIFKRSTPRNFQVSSYPTASLQRCPRQPQDPKTFSRFFKKLLDFSTSYIYIAGPGETVQLCAIQPVVAGHPHFFVPLSIVHFTHFQENLWRSCISTAPEVHTPLPPQRNVDLSLHSRPPPHPSTVDDHLHPSTPSAGTHTPLISNYLAKDPALPPAIRPIPESVPYLLSQALHVRYNRDISPEPRTKEGTH